MLLSTTRGINEEQVLNNLEVLQRRVYIGKKLFLFYVHDKTHLRNYASLISDHRSIISLGPDKVRFAP